MTKKILIMTCMILQLFINPLHANFYNRKEWKHWIDLDKDCQNTRNEILIQNSLEPVLYTNQKKCTVKSGKWKDFYYNEFYYNANDLDIDHVVPLKHANDIGGGNWSPELKKQFANDSDNLVITYKKYNRQKGAKTINEWLPVEKTYACNYVKRWFYIKQKYKLKISDQERETLITLKCN